MDSNLKNVLILSVSVMFVYTMFYSCASCQNIVLQSSPFEVNGFLGLALNYAGNAVGSTLYPVISFYLSPKQILVLSVSLLSLFGVPLIYPYPIFVYIFDTISGFPVGILWCTAGWVVGRYSDVSTLDRNSGIVFFFYMLGPTIGNLVVFFCFQGQTEISDKIRYITISILCAIGFLSPFLMFFFGKPESEEAINEVEEATDYDDVPLLTKKEPDGRERSQTTALETIPKTARLSISHPILILLEPMFLFTGLELAFWTGVLGTCIGNYVYETNAKPLLGLCGVFVGAGEIFAALVRAVIPHVLRLDLILPLTTILGAITFYLSFFLIYLFLPSSTVQHEVSTAAYVTVSYEFFIVLAGFLFGFSDCILQTQLYASIAIWFPGNRENNATFSVYFILQSIGGSIMFGLSTFCHLTVLLVILTVVNFLATTGLLLAEFKFRFDEGKRSQERIHQMIQ